MTLSFDMLPDGDVANDGWTLVSSTYTKVYEILRAFEDDCHVRCPSYRGGAEVKFPIDADDLPDGAIVDSVTVFIRMKTNAGSGPRGVTVNVLSSENRSRYTTRTLYATNTITTFEVGTYTKDPLGKKWDIHRLNKLRLRIFSYNNLFDSVRIYGLYCRVNYHVKPSLTITSPTGTVNTPSPTIEWTYAQLEGEPQKSAQYKIFTLSAASATTFNPDTAPAIFDSGELQGEASSYILPTALNGDDYKVYVRAKSQFGCDSSWASRQFTVSAPSPGVPGDNNAGVAGIPGIGVPTVIPDNYTSSSAIRMQDTSNLLSVQQADFEIASDPLGYVGSNATLSRDTSQAFANGLASLKISASSTADSLAVSTKVEVLELQDFTVTSQFKAGSTGRSVQISARFYDQDHALLGDQILGAGTDSSVTWTEVSATGTSPAGAKYCEVVAWIVGSVSGEAHYIDHVGLMPGTDTAWSDGGHASRNMLTSFLSTGDDPASNTDSWVQANSASTTQRVTASGAGVHGVKCNQMTYIGVSPSIGFRNTSTVFTTPTTGTNYTLNKPTGLADNDLMVAFVTSTEFGTITPPAGWTAVNTAAVDDGTTDVALWILKRTGLASDPSTWATGAVSVSSSRRTAVVVAYSGAAHADDQFIADAVRTDASGNLVHQTATVVNTDPNAWRVAAFAASDDVAGGTFIANKSAPSVPPGISYVGKATSWYQTSDTQNYTINKPSGVQTGDLMIASLALSGNVGSVTAPSGWTLVRRVYKSSGSYSDGDAHSGDVTVAILKRTAGASEPNSWSGTHSDWGQPKISQVVAYRNCEDASAQFIAENAATKSNSTSMTTASVTNTDSKAWRVCLFGGTTSYGASWSGGDVIERSDDTTNLSNFPDCVIQFSDSNGQVSTGSHSRSASMGEDGIWAGVGWIGIIKPLASAPSPGANETERVDNANGSSNPWVSTAVYDSNGVVAAGQHSIYGQMTPGSGSSANSMSSWIGFIRPAASVEGGTVASYPNTMIEIGNLDPDALTLSGNKITVMSSFLGSSAGTPTLAVEFYRANQLISRQTAVGRAFGTSTWAKSWAVFDMPDGTTRIRPELSALDRAISDTVQFDQVAVMLGAMDDVTQEPQWRNGTARPEHPVWSRPVLQYQENEGSGYGDWKVLPGQKARPPRYDLSSGQMFYVDHTVIPLNARRYRVSTLSYGINGDVFSSGYGPASEEARFEPRAWWLKDIQDLSRNMQIAVKWDDMSVDSTNTATTFQPLGEEFPVVVSDGFKSDTFEMQIHCEQAEFTQLMGLLRSGRTLILQSDIDKMWWVRSVGNVTANILATSSRQSRPRRYVKVTWVEVAPQD